MESITPYEERLRFPNVVGDGEHDWTDSLANLVSEVTRQSSMIGYDNIFYFSINIWIKKFYPSNVDFY